MPPLSISRLSGEAATGRDVSREWRDLRNAVLGVLRPLWLVRADSISFPNAFIPLVSTVRGYSSEPQGLKEPKILVPVATRRVGFRFHPFLQPAENRPMRSRAVGTRSSRCRQMPRMRSENRISGDGNRFPACFAETRSRLRTPAVTRSGTPATARSHPPPIASL